MRRAAEKAHGDTEATAAVNRATTHPRHWRHGVFREDVKEVAARDDVKNRQRGQVSCGTGHGRNITRLS